MALLRVATWNVNSLKARLPHVLRWLQENRPHILALQETKTPDEQFPAAELKEAGYEVVFSGQKAYNGMATLSRQAGELLATALPDHNDPQKRLLSVRIGRFHVVNVYVPNGAAVGSDKYVYKLDWLKRLKEYIQASLERGEPTLLLGDFNIAPEDRDVHDPALWEGQVLVSEPERERFRTLLALGLCDCFRLFEQPAEVYTWWDYRAGAFRRNMGLRIDLMLVDAKTATHCTNCRVDVAPRRWERPSDHVPVLAEFDLELF